MEHHKWALVVTNSRDQEIQVDTFPTRDLAYKTATTDILNEKHIQEQENGNTCSLSDENLADSDIKTLTITTPRSTYSYTWHIVKIKNERTA